MRMRHNNSHRTILLFLAAVLLVTAGCAMQKKLQTLANDEIPNELALPPARNYRAPKLNTKVKKDTIKVVDFEGHEMFLMNTTVDSTGETTVTDVLSAAVVSASFRHLAERNGKIGIDFEIRVPGVYKEKKWQLRLTPVILAGSDSVILDQVVVTGGTYRELEELADMKLQELDQKIETSEGATHKNLEAVRDYFYNRYYMPKSEHIHIDTLIKDDYEDFVYNYSYDYQPSPKLRKIEVVVDGEVLALNDYKYYMPRSEALTFYISSLSSFVDGTEKYKTKVISRKLAANKSYNIEFALGKWPLDPNFMNNAKEISAIEKHLTLLLENKEYDLDSVVVTASASPEGTYSLNNELSEKRSESIARYFNSFINNKVDSINRTRVESFAIDIESGSVKKEDETVHPISFISRSLAENWTYLDTLVKADTVMTSEEIDQYFSCSRTESDVDSRELSMKRYKWYNYVREQYYPKLRAVRFDFNLHRKGMVKDTVHTTILDSTYMLGVQAIRDRDYDKAVELLNSYNDYNTALAYCASGKNLSALQILEKIPDTPQTHYMKAIIYARLDDEEKAVQEYVESCKEDRTYINRGNLDPEISTLIKKYNINLLESEDDDFGW